MTAPALRHHRWGSRAPAISTSSPAALQRRRASAIRPRSSQHTATVLIVMALLGRGEGAPGTPDGDPELGEVVDDRPAALDLGMASCVTPDMGRPPPGG